jgi:hypothetical protein
LEEIFNKIIEIDEKAKGIVNIEKEKKINLEEHIESEFGIKKVVLDMEFKDEVENQKKKYNEKFQEAKEQIDDNVQKEMEELKNIYSIKENEIIRNIIDDIKNEEN